jgi:hypothetical protein
MRSKGRNSRLISAGGITGPVLATEDGAAVVLACGELDRAAGGVVADGVVDQVGGQPLDQARVAEHRRGVQQRLNLDAFPLGLGPGGAQVGRSGIGQVGGLTAADAAFAGGHGERALQKVFLVLAGFEDLLAGGAPLLDGRLRSGSNRIAGSLEARSDWPA